MWRRHIHSKYHMNGMVMPSDLAAFKLGLKSATYLPLRNELSDDGHDALENNGCGIVHKKRERASCVSHH